VVGSHHLVMWTGPFPSLPVRASDRIDRSLAARRAPRRGIPVGRAPGLLDVTASRLRS